MRISLLKILAFVVVATISVQFTESVVWVNFKQGLYPNEGDSSFIPTGNTVLGFLVAIPFLLIAIGLTGRFSKRTWLKSKVWQRFFVIKNMKGKLAEISQSLEHKAEQIFTPLSNLYATNEFFCVLLNPCSLN